MKNFHLIARNRETGEMRYMDYIARSASHVRATFHHDTRNIALRIVAIRET